VIGSLLSIACGFFAPGARVSCVGALFHHYRRIPIMQDVYSIAGAKTPVVGGQGIAAIIKNVG
jgi:hypothetical protein